MLFHAYPRVFKNKKNNRRAAVIVWTVVSTTVILGFSALAVDMGYTYHVQTELQRTADAAAMAAASQMADINSSSEQAILDIARTYAQKNKTAGIAPTVEEGDIVMGRSIQDGDGRTTFNEGEQPFDAVKVTVRLTHGSANGPVPLFFGKALGKPDVDLTASAIAMLVPRDIAVVIDLSNSMSYDSQLQHERTTTINNQEVWQDLGSHTYGNMKVFHNNASEMLNYTDSYNSTIITKLGLNGVTYPYPRGSWDQYVSYVKGLSCKDINNVSYKNRYGLRTFVNYLLEKRHLQSETPQLATTRVQPVYAVKQAVDEFCTYLGLMESGDHLSLHSYSDIANIKTNPNQHQQHLTPDFTLIKQTVYLHQAGGYGQYTNIYAGIENGITELTSGLARENAKKVIFVLTDGNANVNTFNQYCPPNADGTGPGWNATIQGAEHAASLGIQIYTITLGTDACQPLMEDVANIGKGVHYHVPTLNVEQYSEDLKRVFRTLGGKRPVRLIQ